MSHSRHPWYDAAFDASWVLNFQQEKYRINLIPKLQFAIHVFFTRHIYQNFLYFRNHNPSFFMVQFFFLTTKGNHEIDGQDCKKYQ